MVISYGTNDTVSIKAKDETITVGDGIAIGSYRIVSAGEYDIAGVQCEASYLDKATAYFVRTEDLTIAFLSDADTSVTKLDDASNTDILIIDIRSDVSIDDVKSILKSLEPAYLVLTGSGSTDSLATSLGLPKLDNNQLKVTRSSLPLEGTTLVAR